MDRSEYGGSTIQGRPEVILYLIADQCLLALLHERPDALTSACEQTFPKVPSGPKLQGFFAPSNVRAQKGHPRPHRPTRI